MAVEVSAVLDKFNCQTCKWGRHCDESNPAPFEKWSIKGIIDSKTCIKPMISDASWLFIKLWRHYRNNILPFNGGILDQPNAYSEAMEIIDSRMVEISGRK